MEADGYSLRQYYLDQVQTVDTGRCPLSLVTPSSRMTIGYQTTSEKLKSKISVPTRIAEEITRLRGGSILLRLWFNRSSKYLSNGPVVTTFSFGPINDQPEQVNRLVW